MRYEEYKKSLYPFDRMIPSHWEETYLSRAYSLKSITGHTDEDLLSVFLDKGVINYNESNKKQVHKPSEDMSKYQLVEPGDFVMNNQQAWRGSVGVSKYRGIISPAYYIWAPRNDYNPKYMNFMLRDKDIVDQFVLASKGVGSIQRQIYVPYMKTTVLAIPPHEEQDQIVRYLDWQLSKINKLIHGYQREIKLLEERKNNAILNLVTGQFFKAEKHQTLFTVTQYSIPAHWTIKPLCAMAHEKSICNCSNLELLSVYLDEGVVPFSSRSEKRTNTTSKDTSKYQRVDPGDFVLNNQQAWRGSVGVSNYLGIVSPAYIVLAMDNQLDRQYANYLFRSRVMIDQFHVVSKGVGSIQRNIYFSEMKRAKVIIPPFDEQISIVEEIKNVEAGIKGLIEKINKQIEFLHEYRTRLISDVVTGQMDVRGIEIPDYEAEADVDFENEADENDDTIGEEAENDE